MPDYVAPRMGLPCEGRRRKTQMAILNIIKKMVTELVASSDADYTLDSVAYHVQADDRELRFSPSSALRRYY
jgi:hypothetical protein